LVLRTNKVFISAAVTLFDNGGGVFCSLLPITGISGQGQKTRRGGFSVVAGKLLFL
jgi:hypothetical protein